MPVTSEIASVNMRTVESMPVSARRGISAGAMAISHDLAQNAMTTPPHAPPTASTIDSVTAAE